MTRTEVLRLPSWPSTPRYVLEGWALAARCSLVPSDEAALAPRVSPKHDQGWLLHVVLVESVTAPAPSRRRSQPCQRCRDLLLRLRRTHLAQALVVVASPR